MPDVGGMVASWLARPTPEQTSGKRSGVKPWPGHSVVFLGKTIYSHSASLHPGVFMGTDEFKAGGQPCDGLASHPGGSRNAPNRFMLQKQG